MHDNDHTLNGVLRHALRIDAGRAPIEVSRTSETNLTHYSTDPDKQPQLDLLLVNTNPNRDEAEA